MTDQQKTKAFLLIAAWKRGYLEGVTNVCAFKRGRHAVDTDRATEDAWRHGFDEGSTAARSALELAKRVAADVAVAT